MQWLDVCFYCGSAGWGQQDSVPLVVNASAGGHHLYPPHHVDSLGAAGSAFTSPAAPAAGVALSGSRKDGVGSAAEAVGVGEGEGVVGKGETVDATGLGGGRMVELRLGGSLPQQQQQQQREQEQQQKLLQQKEKEHLLEQQPKRQQLQVCPRLFCADCGECFHSWCTAAPVRTMDTKAVAAWRCPNCKARGRCLFYWCLFCACLGDCIVFPKLTIYLSPPLCWRNRMGIG